MTVYSLLIGINEYQGTKIHSLNGCHNDVDLLSETLQRKLSVKKENIKTLKSSEATRKNIIEQFQQHLTQQMTKDDIALFYFSGHGAQSDTPEIFWDIESDRLEESLVCHDSRVDDLPDLRDKELRYLIKDLADTGAHIVILLDCCHGGHVTRDMEQVRMAPKNSTKNSLSSYLYNDRMLADLKNTGGLAEGKHILISACQDSQLSREQLLGENLNIHGLFTYSLCETLNTLQHRVSYRELRNRIHASVSKKNMYQSPQVEAIAGAKETQTIFGGDIQPITLLVIKQKNSWIVNAGSIHGLHKNDEIALFKESVDAQQLKNAIARAKIQTLNSFDSELELIGDSKLEGCD